MASLTRWTWVSVNSGSWWWTGRPGVLRFMGSQRVGHDWATDLIWSEVKVTQLCLTFCDPMGIPQVRILEWVTFNFSRGTFPTQESNPGLAHCRRVPSLGLEDPLEKEMATYSSILAYRISWMEEPGGLQSIGSQRVGHNWSDWARTCGLTKQRLPKYRMRPFPLNCASFRWCYNQHFITWVPKRIPFVENS